MKNETHNGDKPSLTNNTRAIAARGTDTSQSQLARTNPNSVAPTVHDTQPRRVAAEKLAQLGFLERHFGPKRKYAKYLAEQVVADERADCEHFGAVLATFRDAKLGAFREYCDSELVRFGMERRATLVEDATLIHQRLASAMLQRETAFLQLAREKIGVYQEFSADLPDHTDRFRERLVPDLEKYLEWADAALEHAKGALMDRVKRI